MQAADTLSDALYDVLGLPCGICPSPCNAGILPYLLAVQIHVQSSTYMSNRTCSPVLHVSIQAAGIIPAAYGALDQLYTHHTLFNYAHPLFAISSPAYHPYNFTAFICHHIVCGSATWIVFQPRALRISTAMGISMFITTIPHLVYLTNSIRQPIEPLYWLSASVCPAYRYSRRQILAMAHVVNIHHLHPFSKTKESPVSRTPLILTVSVYTYYRTTILSIFLLVLDILS